MNKRNARIAGLWYLLMAITGPIGLVYVPSRIIAAGDPAATAANIISSEILFRFGILSNFICQISFIFLVLALDKLFKGVDEKSSKLMISLVIAAVPIAFIIEIFQIAAMQVLIGSDYLNVFRQDQINAIVLSLLDLHEKGVSIAGYFWGLWLFPFGRLIIKSGYIPKILGILLIISCFSYLADSSIALLFPEYSKNVSNILSIPAGLGEISMILWLLIKGVSNKNKLAMNTNQANEINELL